MKVFPIITLLSSSILLQAMAQAETACRVDYTIEDAWSSGYTVSIQVHNDSVDAAQGWTLRWQMGPEEHITNLWNGQWQQTAQQVTVTNEFYNADLSAGGSQSFGFNGQHSGQYQIPTAFYLNDTLCGEQQTNQSPVVWHLTYGHSQLSIAVFDENDSIILPIHDVQGTVRADGTVTVSIDLSSFDGRDSWLTSQMQTHILQVDQVSMAQWQGNIATDVLDQLLQGQPVATTLQGDLTLLGNTIPLPLPVRLTQIEQQLYVTLSQPIPLSTLQFNLTDKLHSLTNSLQRPDIFDTVRIYAETTWLTDDSSQQHVPQPPNSLGASNLEHTSVRLVWQDNSQTETAFVVQRQNSANAWQSLITTMAQQENAFDNQISFDTQYQYRVMAVNQWGESDYSPSASLAIGHPLPSGEVLYQELSCNICHGVNGEGSKFAPDLTTPVNATTLSEIIRDTMPPGDPGACDTECADALARYILDNFTQDSPISCAQDSYRPRQLRLLTRREYSATVQDLLGVSSSEIANFPVETRIGGFDNNSAQALVTTRHADEYLIAARDLAKQALAQRKAQLLSCQTEDQACFDQFISQFGSKAFRRPLSDTELTQYRSFYQDDFNSALENTIAALLMSPNFLYRFEMGTQQADGSYQLSNYEIASQLSYLFWGSMPDDALFTAAANGELTNATKRLQQAQRLLQDPRSRTQLGLFAGQWLGADPLYRGNKNTQAFPEYSDAIHQALDQELIAFFNHVVFESTGQFDELLLADYLLANPTIADYYGLTAPDNTEFSVVPAEQGRGGILALGSFLASHATSDDSSPIKRGVFVREHLLCHDLPAPAPDIDNSPPGLDPNLTTRERFQQHSDNASCYSCHQFIDGIGFGFERFDGAGGYREIENGKAVDDSGTVVGLNDFKNDNSIDFNGVHELSQLIANSSSAHDCMAVQYYRFSQGALDEASDRCAIVDLQAQFKNSQYDLQTLFKAIVTHPNFILRRSQP